MHPNNLISLACAILLLTLVGLAVYTRRKADNARAAGYDQGYDDAKRSHDDRVTALHEDLERLHLAKTNLIAEHRLERDAIIQDCDARIAVFARRSTPCTLADVVILEEAARLAELLSRTLTGFGSSSKAQQAIQVAQQTLNIAQRVRAALDVPATPDAMQLIQAQHAEVAA